MLPFLGESMSNRYFVETSRYSGSYKTRYSFPDTAEGFQEALFYYKCINVGKGYNKRLRDNYAKQVLARVKTYH